MHTLNCLEIKRFTNFRSGAVFKTTQDPGQDYRAFRNPVLLKDGYVQIENGDLVPTIVHEASLINSVVLSLTRLYIDDKGFRTQVDNILSVSPKGALLRFIVVLAENGVTKWTDRWLIEIASEAADIQSTQHEKSMECKRNSYSVVHSIVADVLPSIIMEEEHHIHTVVLYNFFKYTEANGVRKLKQDLWISNDRYECKMCNTSCQVLQIHGTLVIPIDDSSVLRMSRVTMPKAIELGTKRFLLKSCVELQGKYQASYLRNDRDWFYIDHDTPANGDCVPSVLIYREEVHN